MPGVPSGGSPFILTPNSRNLETHSLRKLGQFEGTWTFVVSMNEGYECMKPLTRSYSLETQPTEEANRFLSVTMGTGEAKCVRFAKHASASLGYKTRSQSFCY